MIFNDIPAISGAQHQANFLSITSHPMLWNVLLSMQQPRSCYYSKSFFRMEHVPESWRIGHQLISSAVYSIP
jgi:hypothetical protein